MRHRARIKSLADLADLASRKRAVVCPQIYYLRNPIPASWVFNMTGPLILRAISAGLIVYKRGSQKRIPSRYERKANV